MSSEEHIPAPLTSGRLFTGMFLAAYGLLAVDLLTGEQSPLGWLALLAGAAYVLAGTLGFAAIERSERVGPTYAYFALMVPLGAVIFESSSTGGTFLLLAVAAQSMRVLPPFGALLIGLLLPLLHVRMAWPNALRESATLLAALAFLYVLSRAITDAERARAALATANRQLRNVAAQREELAAARERNRIAREIHDSLGHYLTVVHVQIQAAQAVRESDPARSRDALEKARALTQDGLREVRNSVATLRASPLDNRHVAEALQRVAEEHRTSGLDCLSSVLGSSRPLSPAAALTLYRAGQEALTNVRKHARATRAELTLDFRTPGRVTLRVADDGVGAPPEAGPTGGFGLLGLRERAALLGGRVHVARGIGSGFALEVEVPG